MFDDINKNVPKFVPYLGPEPGILNLPAGTIPACRQAEGSTPPSPAGNPDTETQQLLKW